MRYTIIGDPHCTPKNLSTIHELFNIAENLGNTVIWMGDLLHTKEIVQSSCLNAYFHYFRESDLHHIVLVGNHDQHSAGSESHSLEPLKVLPNVTVVDKPMVIDDMSFIPYYQDLNALREVIQAVETSTVFAHLDVVGFDYGNAFLAQSGLKLEEVSHFKLIISGHFHKYQERGNLMYIGTPFSHSYGESNQLKYIATLNTDTNELTVIPTDFPKHMTYEVNANDTSNLQFTPNSKDYNRVILTGTKSNIAKFQKDFYPNVRFLERPDAEIATSPINESDTPETIFSKWAREIKRLDQQTIDLGLKIIKDVE